jgi:16S rRNA (guanine527-N7)-methyltransferase
MLTNENENAGMSLEEIAHFLSPYIGRAIPEPQLKSLATYLALLKKWNQTIPLTAIEGDNEIVTRHFGESMFAGSLVPLERGRLADVGSGAGFPGIPLKIAYPELQITLVEPNIKKCAFLREVQGALGMHGVEVARSRYEDFGAPNSFDFICSRALGGYRHLLHWSETVLKPEGRVILWLGAEDSNLMARTKGWNWALPVSIPESRRRVVLIGQPAT